MFKFFRSLLGFCAGICLIWSCTKSSTTTSTSSNSTSTLSSFAATMAEELVVSSPTAQKTTTAFVPTYTKTLEGVVAMAVPSADAAPETKQDALEDLLDQTSPDTCAVSLNVVASGNANCYGPSVNYTSHEFDNSNGSWPGGDLGIWEESNTGGEACIAAQLNSQIKGAASMIDLAQFITASMSCVAKKNGQSLPDIGGSLTLTSSMASQITINSSPMTVTSAVLARSSNDSSGNPVYITTLDGTAAGKTYSIRLKHISTAADDSTNKGKISIKVNDGSVTDGASLEYEQSSATAAKMLLKSINANSGSLDPYTSATNFTVDYSKAWNNNAKYFLASLDPTTYAGTYSYAWQAGNGDSHTRVFNAVISGTGASQTGQTFFGFGPTMQTGPGAISGMICAWTGPDQTHTPVSKVQRQDLTFSSTKFIVSGTSYTVFDPVADCDASGSMSMSWNSGASTRAVNSTTENLRNLSEVTTAIGTLPTAPTNVDL